MKNKIMIILVACMLGIGMSSQAVVEAIAIGLEGTNTYVVPPGKTLIIEYISNGVGSQIIISSTYVVNFTPPGGSRYFVMAVPGDSRMAVKFPAGTTIHCWDSVQETFEYTAFSGLLVDDSDLYASRGKIDNISVENDMLTMHVSGPPGQRSQVSVESTYDLLGADWHREQEALVTRTAKGSSEFDIEVPLTSTEQAFYQAQFRPKN